MLTREQTAILGGSWLLALWAHVALPDALPFAIASLALLGSAAWLLLGAARLARGGDGQRVHVDPGRQGTAESAELQDMRGTLRALEAEIHAIDDQHRTVRGTPDPSSNPAGRWRT